MTIYKLKIHGNPKKYAALQRYLSKHGWELLEAQALIPKANMMGKIQMLQLLTHEHRVFKALKKSKLAARLHNDTVKFALAYHTHRHYFCGSLPLAEYTNIIEGMINTGASSAMYFGLVKPHALDEDRTQFDEHIQILGEAAAQEWVGFKW